jgi:hypothetical protein
MSNHNVQRFQFFNATSEQFDHSENPTGHSQDADLSLFRSYIHRNEINQNLSNAPSAILPTLSQSGANTLSPISNSSSTQSPALRRLLREFEEKILFDHPHIPCAYCSILMTKSSARWTRYDVNERYTLKIAFPDVDPVLPQHVFHSPAWKRFFRCS